MWCDRPAMTAVVKTSLKLLNLFKFIFCPIWHDIPSVLQSSTKLQSIWIYISIIIYNQTLSDDVHFMKYHVVRPSRNNHFGTIMLQLPVFEWILSLTSLPRTHGFSNRFVTLSNLEKKNNLFNGWYVVPIFRYHVV